MAKKVSGDPATEVDARRGEFSADEQGRDRFGVLYDGWYLAYRLHARGLEGVQMCNAIGRKLRVISLPRFPDKPETEIRARSLPEGKARAVLLSPGEHAKLCAMLEGGEEGGPIWLAERGEQVEEAMTWLKNWPTVKASAASLEH